MISEKLKNIAIIIDSYFSPTDFILVVWSKGEIDYVCSNSDSKLILKELLDKWPDIPEQQIGLNND